MSEYFGPSKFSFHKSPEEMVIHRKRATLQLRNLRWSEPERFNKTGSTKEDWVYLEYLISRYAFFQRGKRIKKKPSLEDYDCQK